jgi:transcription elongation GreA/GreB family factor
VSVAFTREEDLEAAAADLPDRPISPHANLVTPEGLAALDAALATARAAYASARASADISAERTAMARAARDLRYWAARRASAQLVAHPPDTETVRFGSTVEIAREDGRRQSLRIVGEDEADPAAGLISHVSPLARALMGRSPGETVTAAGREVEILATGQGRDSDAWSPPVRGRSPAAG